MTWLNRLIVSTLSIIATPYILHGVHVKNIVVALVMAIVLAILNTIIKPILVLFTIPVTILSLGLFLLVINGGIIMLAAYIVDGFSVDSFGTAVLFSIVTWFINMVLNAFAGSKKD
jgi:putative membrane protein